MSRFRPPRRRLRRRLLLPALTFAALTALAPAAQAADLLVLNGDQAQLSGSNDYGIVYIDGELRLAGDTTINAASVYIGPNAWLRPCYVPSSGDTCTAGRSLTIRSASTLTIEPGLDLTGRSGANRPGGSLVLSGGDVAVGGAITTVGLNAPSGSVSIDSRGLVTTGGITANGAPVSILAARNVNLNGDVRTEGIAQVPSPPGRLQGGAPVSVSSTGGDIAVRGNISTWGRDAGAGQGGGGLGADVALSGGDVRAGAIDTTGGNSTDADGGATGAIRLTARGTLHALGRLDAGGASSTNGTATDGAAVTAGAAGAAALAGGVAIAGGNAPAGGGRGGRLDVEAGSVALGNVTATGGSATASPSPRDGGQGGTVAVRSHGATSLGAINAAGGNGPARGGAGGAVAVSGQSISVGQVTTAAAAATTGPGADGGPVTLDADGSLALGGTLRTSGADASASTAAVFPGGSAGRVLLRAAEGTLDLGGGVWATGGRGSASTTAGVRGGAGGAGGAVDLVARKLGTVVSIVAAGAAGGDYGANQGPGGRGGAIHAFTDGPLLDDLKVVSADGGAGQPAGSAGPRTVEASPTGLAVAPGGVLAWTSRSPGASRFRVLRSVNGAAPDVLAETTGTSLTLATAMCQPVTLTVVAVHDGVRWASDAPAAVSYTAQPSATQRCGDTAGLKSAEASVVRRLAAVRRARWRVSVPLVAAGIGHVDATLRRGVKKVITLGTAALDVKQPGAVTVSFTLPKGQRHTGRLTLVLVVTSPDGSRKATTTVPVEVRATTAAKPKHKHKTTGRQGRR